MMPAIVVELPPHEAASQYARALLDSCSVGAQGRARCALGQDATSDRNLAVAVVTWGANAHVTARIEIGVRVSSAQKWQTRYLTFASDDPEVERWRATGFAIATVVGDLLDQQEASDASEPAATSPPSPPAVFSPLPRAARGPASELADAAPDRSTAKPQERTVAGGALPRWWLDGVFALGIAEADGGVAPGAELRVGRRLDAHKWFVAGEAHCSTQVVSAVRVLRPGISAGIGLVALDLAGVFRLALRLEPRVDLLDVAATDPAGRYGHNARAVLGVRQVGETSWMWSDRLGLVAEATVTEWAGPIEVQEHGIPVTVIPPVDFATDIGLRWSFE